MYYQVLSRVVEEDPPVLPPDAMFSSDFRSFVTNCLTKNYKLRPKYKALLEHSFIRLYDYPENNANELPAAGCQWFDKVMQHLEPRSVFLP